MDEIKGVGVNHFHFSLNWSALVPTGDVTRPNATLLGYYRCFTRQLLQANVTPVVTLWHHTRQRSSLPGSLDATNKWLSRWEAVFFLLLRQITFLVLLFLTNLCLEQETNSSATDTAVTL